MEFMRLYIEQGRFGEFVNEIITKENKRRTEQAEKEDDDRLWMAFIRSYTDKSFADWKSEILRPVRGPKAVTNRHGLGGTGKRDEDMTKEDIDHLLTRLFPKK